MPSIEFVTLAHHAEAINGLLYLQGAGWSEVEQPFDTDGNAGTVHLGIGVSLLIGWNETNRSFPLTITVAHEDGETLFEVEGAVEAGRPAGSTPGADIRSVLAVSGEVQFGRAGGYVVKASVGDDSGAGLRSVQFRVLFPATRERGPAGPAGPADFTLPE
ncbi:MAG: hypothetical protein WAO41_10185 [Candidatus Nanopelagicales bacterium]